MSEAYPPYAPALRAPLPRDTNWKGILGLVGAAVGLPILAIIFGHVMMADIRKGATTSRKLARANLWVGYVIVAIATAIVMVIIVFLLSHGIAANQGEGACVSKPGYEWVCG